MKRGEEEKKITEVKVHFLKPKQSHTNKEQFYCNIHKLFSVLHIAIENPLALAEHCMHPDFRKKGNLSYFSFLFFFSSTPSSSFLTQGGRMFILDFNQSLSLALVCVEIFVMYAHLFMHTQHDERL